MGQCVGGPARSGARPCVPHLVGRTRRSALVGRAGRPGARRRGLVSRAAWPGTPVARPVALRLVGRAGRSGARCRGLVSRAAWPGTGVARPAARASSVEQGALRPSSRPGEPGSTVGHAGGPSRGPAPRRSSRALWRPSSRPGEPGSTVGHAGGPSCAPPHVGRAGRSGARRRGLVSRAARSGTPVARPAPRPTSVEQGALAPVVKTSRVEQQGSGMPVARPGGARLDRSRGGGARRVACVGGARGSRRVAPVVDRLSRLGCRGGHAGTGSRGDWTTGRSPD